MSGDRISTAIYDREGNLWVGTPTGVDRFRETKLTPIAWPGPVNWPTVAVDTNGAVWVAARNAAPSTLFKVGERVVPHAAHSVDADMHLPRPPWRHLGRRRARTVDAKGRRTRAGAGSRAVILCESRHPDNPRHRARSRRPTLGVDCERWCVPPTSRARLGAFRRQGLVLTVLLPSSPTDSLGRTWLGYASGQVVRVVGDSIQQFTAADGPGVGGVLAISIHDDRVWVAGQFGVAALDEARRPVFVRLATAGDPLYGVSESCRLRTASCGSMVPTASRASQRRRCAERSQSPSTKLSTSASITATGLSRRRRRYARFRLRWPG